MHVTFHKRDTLIPSFRDIDPVPNKSVLNDVKFESQQQHVRTRSCTLPSYARKCKVWRVSLCVIPAALPLCYTINTRSTTLLSIALNPHITHWTIVMPDSP